VGIRNGGVWKRGALKEELERRGGNENAGFSNAGRGKERESRAGKNRPLGGGVKWSMHDLPEGADDHVLLRILKVGSEREARYSCGSG